MFAALWCSPGIVLLIVNIFQWYKGKDITYGDLKTIGVLSTFGVFIPMLEKEIAAISDCRVFLKGRKQEAVK